MNTTTPFPILTQALAYQLIEPARLDKFFASFSGELAAGGISFPDHETANGSYYHSISAALASPDQLPVPLRNALLTLEKAATPDNANRLDDAIQRRIRTVNLYNRCAIDYALELWFRAPDELDQFRPSAIPSPRGEGQGEGKLGTEDQASSIKLPESPDLSLTDSLNHSLTTPAAGVRGNRFDVGCSKLEVQCSSSPSDAETFASLARLSPTEYDRVRRAEAKRLDLRIETLDAEVAKYRAELNLEAQANAVQLPTVEPWPEPVNGAETLDQVSSRHSLYLVLPPGAADAMCLWTAHTHALAAFHLSPRLSLYSPKPGCGKTTAFDVLTTMLPRPLRTENISPAVLFRLVHQYQPALLLDEVDAYLPQSEELRGLLNAGHKRGACAYRCEGEGKAVRAFRAFAPAALAGIGSLPATLRDRSVLVPLVQAEAGQIAARFDPLRTDIEKTLARKLARWTADNFDALAACDPPLPPGAFNRLADNWRPLLAVAQIAGGDWPARALAAFANLAAPTTVGMRSTASDCSTLDLRPETRDRLRLLTDIRQIFTQTGVTKMSSRDLAAALPSLSTHSLTDSLTHSLSPVRLARLLSPLGIPSRVLRINGRCVRGYQLADFHDALTRYLTNDSGLSSQSLNADLKAPLGAPCL